MCGPHLRKRTLLRTQKQSRLLTSNPRRCFSGVAGVTQRWAESANAVKRRDVGYGERPPGETCSLFTSSVGLAACTLRPELFLCARDVSASDERGHLCGRMSLFTPCSSVALSPDNLTEQRVLPVHISLHLMIRCVFSCDCRAAMHQTCQTR